MRRLIPVFAVLVATANFSIPVISQTPGLLIDAAPAAGAVGAGPLPAGVARQRWVSINQGLLSSTAPQLPITLFPGVAVTATLDRTEKTATGYVWIGRIDGMVSSSVTLAVSGSALAGAIVTPLGRFLIRHVSNGLHVVQETDPSTKAPRGEPLRVPGPLQDPPLGGGPRTQDR